MSVLHGFLVATGFCSACFCITEIVLEAQESGRTGGGNGGLIRVAPLCVVSNSSRDDCFMLPRSIASMLMKNLKKQMSTVWSFGMSNRIGSTPALPQPRSSVSPTWRQASTRFGGC